MLFNSAIWVIVAVATSGVIARPWNWPEFVWAVVGAAMLVLFNLLSWQEAVAAVGRGTDVYLFLIGMMLLSEVARKEGLFDWLATQAVTHARLGQTTIPDHLRRRHPGDGVPVERRHRCRDDAGRLCGDPGRAGRAAPLSPHLRFHRQRRARFVLPIANPANLVVFGGQMPALSEWLRYFAGPSLVAILATYVVLRLTQREALDAKVAAIEGLSPLTLGGKIAAIGIALTVAVLLSASAFDRPLGLPTFCAGAFLTAIVLVIARQSPLPILKDISWSVLPLVAGLFVVVAGLNRTGALSALAGNLHDAAATSHAAQVPPQVAGAILIGVDLGPNLSVTGSLATVLWLIALRRDGVKIAPLRFLRYGLLVMPPALMLSLLALSGMSP